VNNGLSILLYVAIAVFVLYRVAFRSLRGILLTRKGLFVMPVILLVIGGFSARSALNDATAKDLVMLGADVLVLAVLGVLRSASSTLSEREGTTFLKGSPLTVALWLATIALRVGFSIVAAAIGVSSTVTTSTIVLTLGVSIAVQNLVTYYRIQQRGLPLAEETRPRVSAGR
jgi:F0F1-type ATP synthase membrane subunit a